jgi:hypothetical protein
MGIKGLFFCSTLFLSVTILSAQSKKSPAYFVTSTHDTTFCKYISYEVTIQGSLHKLEYTDLNDKSIVVKGIANLRDVVTIFRNNSFIDKVPQKPKRPKGYVNFKKREVNGTLIVYLTQQGRTSAGPAGTYDFFIKMPDGTFYKINSQKNMENHIKPFLLECKAFASHYNGDFRTEEKPFMDMIKLYNSLCK